MALDEVRAAGRSKRRRKLGEIVAERIIAEILHQGWREGDVLGTERDFMDRFRISRATFREAMRQVEWHGVAGMRRGANGGLVVKAPPRDAIVFAFKTFFELTKVPAADRHEVAEILRNAERASPGSDENLAISLFLEALDNRTIADLADQRRATGTPAKLSELVAFQIVRDIEMMGAAKGHNLGTEIDLQARYNVSRALLREALRPLELHDIIRVKTGATGGICVQEVDPSYTIDLATTYLSYARIPFSHNWEAHSPLELSAIAKFTERATASDLSKLEKAFIRLNAAAAPHYLVAASEFHEVISDGCGNRALALLIRLFLTYTPKVLPIPNERFLPMLKASHEDVIKAVRERDKDRAHRVMSSMFDHSRLWMLRAEKHKLPSPQQRPHQS